MIESLLPFVSTASQQSAVALLILALKQGCPTQVQALQQAVIKIGEHLSGNQGSSGAAASEEPKGAEYDADVKDEKKDDKKE